MSNNKEPLKILQDTREPELQWISDINDLNVKFFKKLMPLFEGQYHTIYGRQNKRNICKLCGEDNAYYAGIFEPWVNEWKDFFCGKCLLYHEYTNIKKWDTIGEKEDKKEKQIKELHIKRRDKFLNDLER